MFIVWQGWGILAPIIMFFSCMFVNIISDSIKQDYSTTHPWITSLGLVISGIICWYAGKALNNKPGKIFIDEKTGQRVELKSLHTCFFLRVEYWAFICAMLAIFFLTTTFKA